MMQNSTLEEFVYLNQEMAALSRGGVPLDRGLAMLGGEYPGNAGRMAQRIAERIEAGSSLSEALGNENGPFPQLYRAVLEAGVRSGSLAEALESVAASATRLARLRQTMAVAMLYPLCLFLLGYAFFLLLVLAVLPDMLQTIIMFGGAVPPLISRLLEVMAGLGGWLVLPPLFAVLIFFLWWYLSGKARWLLTGRGRNRMASVVLRSRMAIFSDLMSLMTRHGIPLDEAVILAAGATGSQKIQRGAANWSTAWREGRLDGEVLRRAGYAPLVVWLLSSKSDQAALSVMFGQAGATYQRQAAQAARWLAFSLPMLLTGLVGGLIVAAYGLLFFVPWCQLLLELSEPMI